MINPKFQIIFLLFLFTFSYCNGQLVNDVKVNEDTTLASKKWKSKISINDNGNIAIVWCNEYYNIVSANIYCQIYNYKLNKLGNNFRVNSIPDTSYTPDVVIAKNGKIGVVWQNYNLTHVFFRMFSKDGIPLTSEITINDTLKNFEGYPAVACDSNNGFIVVFVYPKSAGGTDVFYQLLDSGGNKVGHNVNVSLIGSVYISPIEAGPEIIVRKDGSFIITWQDIRPPSVPTGDIYMQMFDKNGLPIGVNTRVNDPDFDPEDLQYVPKIAADSSGGFTIAFQDTPYSTGVDRVRYQRFDKNGIKLGSNKTLYGTFYLKGLAGDESGNLVFSLNQEYASINFLYNLRIDKNDNILGDYFPVTEQYNTSLKIGEDIAMYNGKIYNVWGDFRIAGRNIYANVRSYWNPDSTVGINQIGTEVPEKYSLSQNYPNPFNPTTKINFAIPKQGLVTIKIYDILGREVSKLLNEYKTAGTYSIDFNASNLSSGVYFYRLDVNGFSDIKKMMVIK